MSSSGAKYQMGRQTPGFTYIYLPGPATLIVYYSPWTRFGSLRQGWPADNPSECFWLQARVTSRRGTDVAIIRMAGARHLTFLRCSDIKKPPMCLGGLSVLDSSSSPGRRQWPRATTKRWSGTPEIQKAEPDRLNGPWNLEPSK